jgi:hypothetical protein
VTFNFEVSYYKMYKLSGRQGDESQWLSRTVSVHKLLQKRVWIPHIVAAC